MELENHGTIILCIMQLGNYRTMILSTMVLGHFGTMTPVYPETIESWNHETFVPCTRN